MSTLPLRTPSPCVRFSALSSPNCRLSAVSCELPLPPSSAPATFASPVKPKSFICNAFTLNYCEGYKKHGGLGESEAGAMSPLSLRTLCLWARISSISSPNCRLSAVGCKLPFPPKTSHATFARPVKPKSFIRNAYKKHRGAGGCQWDSQSWLSALLSLQPSAFNPLLQSPVTSNEPANL